MVEFDIAKLLHIACEATLEAGKAILEVYDTADFGASLKADLSPLTLADSTAHLIISKHLSATGIPVLSEEGKQIPYDFRKNWEIYWLVDPLDGTKEFLKRNGEFTVNIALMHHNRPVGGVIFAPVLDALYYGSQKTGVFKIENGNRTKLETSPERQTIKALLQKPEIKVIASRSHLTPETEAFAAQFNHPTYTSMGSSLKMMLLSENKADIYPRFAPTMEWDTAAAHAILSALNKGIYQTDLKSELIYNKPDLLNPSFICY